VARRPHHLLRRIAPTLAAAVAAAALVGGLPSPAYADIATQIRHTQARLDALNRSAEAAAERYNAGQIQLSHAHSVARTAQARVAHDDAALLGLRRQAGQFAADAYRGAGTDMGMRLLSSATDPRSVLNGLGALNHVAQSQADLLDTLATARHRQAVNAAAAKTALADEQRTVRGLEADKASVERDAAAAQQLLEQLQVKQAELIKAAADAAARQAAEQRAQELAAQARANAAAMQAFSARAVDGPSQVVARSHYSGDAASVAVRVAEDQLGKPYVWGAEGPDSFDCSGLTKYAYAAAGIELPHYTGDQWNSGRHVAESDLRPGDLIFFHSDLHHMGMYIGGGRLIHAPHSGDVVRIASLSGWFQDNYAGAVRIAG
jgi:cell wall-associated NlpC family hydrolase